MGAITVGFVVPRKEYAMAEFLIALALFLYVCFFLVHAMQRVADP